MADETAPEADAPARRYNWRYGLLLLLAALVSSYLLPATVDPLVIPGFALVLGVVPAVLLAAGTAVVSAFVMHPGLRKLARIASVALSASFMLLVGGYAGSYARSGADADIALAVCKDMVAAVEAEIASGRAPVSLASILERFRPLPRYLRKEQHLVLYVYETGFRFTCPVGFGLSPPRYEFDSKTGVWRSG